MPIDPSQYPVTANISPLEKFNRTAPLVWTNQPVDPETGKPAGKSQSVMESPGLAMLLLATASQPATVEQWSQFVQSAAAIGITIAQVALQEIPEGIDYAKTPVYGKIAMQLRAAYPDTENPDDYFNNTIVE